jgi:S-(hydroxymethyl)glutathione dehydrogenase/alcohol dehydrogenase
MKAAILYETNKPLIIEELDVPQPGYGQVLVRVYASGICHKQVEEIKGKRGRDPYLPHLLGHEGAGIVESIGAGVTQVSPGDHVVLSWIKGAGINAQTPTYYRRGTQINAGWVTTFNEYTLASENRVTKIPTDLCFDKAALLGCAVPTGVGIVINQAKIKPGSFVAVFGVGGVGLNVIQGAKLMSASKIIAVDICEEKLNYARQFGATDIINALKTDPINEIRGFTEGYGVDYAIEATGDVDAMEKCYSAARDDQGVVIIAGNPPYGKKISIDAFPLHLGKSLVGAHGGHTCKERDFPRYIDLYKKGKLKLDELITNRYTLDEINEAIWDMENGRILGRAIIEF